jgi:hypothetical protein
VRRKITWRFNCDIKKEGGKDRKFSGAKTFAENTIVPLRVLLWKCYEDFM